MSIYRYKARDEEGRLISGRMDVSGEVELQKRLENSNLLLVEFSQERRNILGEDITKKFFPVRLRELYTLTLQLKNTLGAGLPLLVSLTSFANDCKNEKLATVLNKVIDDLRSGSSFSEALSKHPNIFSKFYTSMVEVGEASGSLPDILQNLSRYIKRQMEIKKRVTSAVTYPAFLTFIGTGLVSYILIFVMPQFEELYAGSSVSLPLPTFILIHSSKLFAKYWYLFFGGLGGIALGLRLLALNDYGRLAIDRLKLKLPIIGQLTKKICVKRFVDGLYLLYSSGLPILKALNVVKSTIGNRELEKTVESMWNHISSGKDLSSFLALTDFFPSDVLAMFKSGEESGTLQDMLLKISAIYSEDVNYSIDGLISAFEIGIILVMGLGVGFIAIAVLLPIFQLSQGVAG